MKDKKIRKPTKAELTANAEEMVFTHSSSMDVLRRRTLLEFEATQLQDKLRMLRSEAADATQRKARIEASIAGLTTVLTKRSVSAG